MDSAIKAKWVAALRSGKYQQGQNYLRHDGEYCCLGVLCDLIDPAAWKQTGEGKSEWHGARSLFPLEAAARIGIGRHIHLLTMNDEENKSFAEIADWIEQNL